MTTQLWDHGNQGQPKPALWRARTVRQGEGTTVPCKLIRYACIFSCWDLLSSHSAKRKLREREINVGPRDPGAMLSADCRRAWLQRNQRERGPD